MNKIAELLKDVRAIILGLASVGAVILWIGAQYFLTVDEADARGLRNSYRELEGLQIRKGFSQSEQDKQLYNALIEMQENYIKSLEVK